MIKLTLRRALAIQETQIAYYSQIRPNIAELIKSHNKVEGLDLDVERSAVEVNRLVPRGGAIERILNLPDMGGN